MNLTLLVLCWLCLLSSGWFTLSFLSVVCLSLVGIGFIVSVCCCVITYLLLCFSVGAGKRHKAQMRRPLTLSLDGLQSNMASTEKYKIQWHVYTNKYLDNNINKELSYLGSPAEQKLASVVRHFVYKPKWKQFWAVSMAEFLIKIVQKKVHIMPCRIIFSGRIYRRFYHT